MKLLILIYFFMGIGMPGLFRAESYKGLTLQGALPAVAVYGLGIGLFALALWHCKKHGKFLGFDSKGWVIVPLLCMGVGLFFSLWLKLY